MKKCEELMNYFECECPKENHGLDCLACFDIILNNKDILIKELGADTYYEGKMKALKGVNK